MLQALFMQFFVKILRNYGPASNAAITYIPIPLIKSYILIEDSFTRIRYDYAERTVQPSRLKPQTDKPYPFQPLRAEFSSKRTEARMTAAVTFKRKPAFDLEIASRLGYSYPNHFHAAFKNYYKMTVSEYKRTVLNLT